MNTTVVDSEIGIFLLVLKHVSTLWYGKHEYLAISQFHTSGRQTTQEGVKKTYVDLEWVVYYLSDKIPLSAAARVVASRFEILRVSYDFYISNVDVQFEEIIRSFLWPRLVCLWVIGVQFLDWNVSGEYPTPGLHTLSIYCPIQ